MKEIIVPPGSPAAGKPIAELNLPAGTLILLIGRNNAFLVPRGTTTIQENDMLLVFTEPEAFQEIRAKFRPDTPS